MSKTKIQWTNTTWSPFVGCSRISEGCRHCYAERLVATRLAHSPKYHGAAKMTKRGPRWQGSVSLSLPDLVAPLRWTYPQMIFVNSMSDTFHPDVPIEWLARIFNVMASATIGCGKRHRHAGECRTGQPHTFQCLTKRAERMQQVISKELPFYIGEYWSGDAPINLAPWPLENVWLGVSAEDQQSAEARIPYLLETPATVRFVSLEPLLGPIHLSGISENLGWVIIGCESGPKRRPMALTWAEDTVEQCQAAGVPCFVKQIELDGKVTGDIERFPRSLQVREFPTEGRRRCR